LERVYLTARALITISVFMASDNNLIKYNPYINLPRSSLSKVTVAAGSDKSRFVNTHTYTHSATIYLSDFVTV